MKREKSETPPEEPTAGKLAGRLSPNRLLPFAEVASTSTGAIETEKINEIAGLLWLPQSLSEEQRTARIVKALDLFESIAPESGVEAMLAAQMVGTHTAAIECLRRAMVSGQTFEARNAALAHAQRLMSLYAKQLDALDKHRGKGQQTVTIKHVNVASGGQAIVGHIEKGTGAARAPREPAAPRIGFSVAAPDPREAAGRRQTGC